MLHSHVVVVVLDAMIAGADAVIVAAILVVNDDGDDAADAVPYFDLVVDNNDHDLGHDTCHVHDYNFTIYNLLTLSFAIKHFHFFGFLPMIKV